MTLEAIAYQVLALVEALATLFCAIFFWRYRTRFPYHARPALVTLSLMMGMGVSGSLVALGRAFPEAMGCWIPYLALVFIGTFDILGNILRSIHVYYQYVYAQRLIELFSESSIASKTVQEEMLTKRKRIADSSLFIINLIVISGLLIIAVIIYIYDFNFIYRSTEDNECRLAGSVEASVVFALQALLSLPFLIFVQLKLREVKENSYMIKEFQRESILIASILVVFVIHRYVPIVHDFSISTFWILDFFTAFCTLLFVLVLALYPHYCFMKESFKELPRRSRARSKSVESSRSRRSSADPFHQGLRDPFFFLDFQEFLCEEFCVENLLFWKSVEDFRLVRDDELFDMAASIADIFIRDSAPFCVNLSSQQKEDILINLKTAETEHLRHIFNEAQSSSERLMRQDPYRRYQMRNLSRKGSLSVISII